MVLPLLRTGGRWFFRGLIWLVLLLLIVAVAAALVFQFWFLPRVNDYRQDISQAVWRATGVRVEIGALSGHWQNWRPHVDLRKVVLRDAQGQTALEIDEIRSEIAWKSIPLLEMRLHALDASRLALDVRRDARGALYVAGLPLRMEEGTKGGLGDWLLRQDRLSLSESSIRWTDERTGLVPLELSGVTLELRNHFGQHKVRLQATPPAQMAAPFVVTADLRGDVLTDLSDWDGAVNIQLPYVNLGEAHRYWPVGGKIERGAGSIEARFDLDQGRVRKIRAALALAGFHGKLGAELEPLQLDRLAGGVQVERDVGVLEARLTGLSFTTPDGLAQANVSGVFERKVTEAGVLDTRVSFNALDLGLIVTLANRLPLSKDLRARLVAMQPRGRVTGLNLTTREQAGKLVRFTIASEFAGLALKPAGTFPGFSGLSGKVRGDSSGGELSLQGRAAQLDLPRIFVMPLDLDQVDARLNWRTQGGSTEIKVQEFSVANRDAAASVKGLYRYTKGSIGYADIGAVFSRAEASAVWRYAPLVVPQVVREWLRTALIAGRSRQVSVVVRGDLVDFPFANGKPGLFEIKAKAEAGVLGYVPGWPRLEDIACDLSIRGRRLDIVQASGRVFGARVNNAVVAVEDLSPADPRVAIRGEASGRAADFVRYVAESPLAPHAGEAIKKIQVQGEGRLTLVLDIPLKHPEDTKTDGTYAASGNRAMLPWGLGAVDQINGNLRITQHGVSAKGLTGQYLGGPVRLDLNRTDRGMEIVASGRANAAGIGQLVRLGWERHLSGSTDWSGRFRIHPDRVDAEIESSLAGIVSQLPAPLDKVAAETLPLRIERSRHESGMGFTRVQLGERALLRYLSPVDDWFAIKTGELVFNGRSGDSEREGLRVSGRLAQFDADAWSRVAKAVPEGAGDGTPARKWEPPSLVLKGLQIDRLHWFSRDFDALTISGRHTTALTQLQVEGKTAQGELQWRGQGDGQLLAKLGRLHWAASKSTTSAIGDTLKAETLPAIEAQIADFRMGERELGRLALSAVPQGRVWQLRQLDLVSPDGTAQLRGMYDLRGRVPRMNVDVRVDVQDIGNYFARLRLPQGIRRGKAQLEGSLQWSGAPYAIDLPSLAGRLTLDAKQGQFVKVDPGVGKLLGVLSMQALPRRLTLDFRDVFSKGFAFNQVTATSDISGGVAATQDFKMIGSGAAVELKGTANLLNETQDLKVRVLPGLSDGVSLVGALVNPGIGAAAYLAQKVFNYPVDRFFAVDYTVTGPWADPVVTKVVKEAPEAKGRR